MSQTLAALQLAVAGSAVYFPRLHFYISIILWHRILKCARKSRRTSIFCIYSTNKTPMNHKSGWHKSHFIGGIKAYFPLRRSIKYLNHMHKHERIFQLRLVVYVKANWSLVSWVIFLIVSWHNNIIHWPVHYTLHRALYSVLHTCATASLGCAVHPAPAQHPVLCVYIWAS